MAKKPTSTNRNPFLRGVDASVVNRAKQWDGFLSREASHFEAPIEGSPFRKATAFTGLDHRRVSFDGRTEFFGISNHEQATKHRIASCREAYENSGIIGNIIDIMVDFALEQLTIQHTIPEVERFFQRWMKTAGVFQVSEQILKGLYRDGNVPILKFFGTLNAEEKARMRKVAGKHTKKKSKKSTDAEEDKTESQILDENPIVRDTIPFRYEMLDILRVFRTGSQILGTIGWEYQFDANDMGFRGIRTAREQSEETQKAIKKLEEQIGVDATARFKQNGRISLPKNRLSMFHYKRDGFRSWATPLLWRVIPDVKFKKLIRDMDISVAEGVTNALTIVKLGAIEQGLVPSQKKFKKITSMLRTPQKSKIIVWDNLLSVETIFPPVEKFFSDKKYKQVDADIRAGLGIPEVLVNGQGTNFSNSFLSIKTLMERLQTGRRMLEIFWQEEAVIVTKNMGFRKPPVVRMNKMSLTDDEVEKRFMVELYDRQLLSVETMLARFGENFQIEVDRIRKEDRLRREIEEGSDDPSSEHALVRIGKFTPAPLGESDPEEPKTPESQGRNGEKGGRPPGTKRRRKTQTTPDSPQGKNKATSRTICRVTDPVAVNDGFDKLYRIVAKSIAIGKGYKTLRELKDEDREKILHAIGRALPKLVGKDRWTRDLVQTALKSEGGTKLDRCVEKVTRDEVKKFRQRNGKSPNKKAMRKITSKAFRISNASLNKDRS